MAVRLAFVFHWPVSVRDIENTGHYIKRRSISCVCEIWPLNFSPERLYARNLLDIDLHENEWRSYQTNAWSRFQARSI